MSPMGSNIPYGLRKDIPADIAAVHALTLQVTHTAPSSPGTDRPSHRTSSNRTKSY